MAQGSDTIQTKKLSDVEVTANKAPIESRYLSTISSYTITQQTLTKQGISNLSEAMRKFNGVVVKDYGGIGGIKTVSIRGMGAEHTAVAYDGIVMNNAQSGQIDIGRFSMDNISYVSLNIGQSDNIFQTARAFASSGVIEVQTIKPEFKDRNYEGSAKVSFGSWGQVNPYINYSHKLSNTLAINANLNWKRADGQYSYIDKNGIHQTKKKRQNSDIDIWQTELNIYNDWGTKGALDAKFNYYDSERGLPNAALTYKEHYGERLWDRNILAQLGYRKTWEDKINFKSSARYTNNYTHYEEVDIISNENTYREQEAYLSNSLKYKFNDQLSVSVAEDLYFNTLKAAFTSSFGSNPPQPKRYNSLTVVAAQYKTKRLTINAHTLFTYISEKVKNDQPDNIHKRFSPSISFSYQPIESQSWRIRASYKHGFRVPTFTELYYTTLAKDLKPEIANQFNIGSTFIKCIENSPINYINFSIDGYYNRIDDKIVIIPTLFIPTTLNIGKVDIKGIDLRLISNFKVSKDIDIEVLGTYSYMSALDKTDSNSDSYNSQLVYTPKHSGSCSVELKNPWVNINYSALFSDKRYIKFLEQDDIKNQIKAYTDHSISLYKSFKLKNDLSSLYIQANVLNIWNTNYELVKLYPMQGREYRVTIGYKF